MLRGLSLFLALEWIVNMATADATGRFTCAGSMYAYRKHQRLLAAAVCATAAARVAHDCLLTVLLCVC
jgi:hypothetical protein